MTKGIIRTISNKDADIWYAFEPTNTTLELLDDVFDLSNTFDFNQFGFGHDYTKYIDDGEFSAVLENDDVLAFMILTPKHANLIIRKNKQWEKFHEDIHKDFVYAESE